MNSLLQEALASKPRRLTGALAVGVTVGTTASAQEVHRINGASSIRVRFKATKAGTLYVAILKHDQTTEELHPAPRTVPVLDATEVIVTIDDIMGESYALIKFTAGAADSDISYCDVYRTFNPQTAGIHGSAIDDFTVPGGAGSYATEEIYLNRDYLAAGVGAPSDLGLIKELQVIITALPASASIQVDLLKPGGDAATAGDWLLDQVSYTTVAVQTQLLLSRWPGVRIRAKSGGTGGTATAAVSWRG